MAERVWSEFAAGDDSTFFVGRILVGLLGAEAQGIVKAAHGPAGSLDVTATHMVHGDRFLRLLIARDDFAGLYGQLRVWRSLLPVGARDQFDAMADSYEKAAREAL